MANTAFDHSASITVPSSTVNNAVITWNGTTGKSFNNTALVIIDAGAVSGVTSLTVDNLNLNGNTISSTAGTDLLITPLAGQQLILDGTIIVDAGVVTGATSITATEFHGGGGNLTGISAGATLSGSTSNTIVTVTGADAMVGEANLVFDGTNLGIGVTDPDQFLEIKGGNNAYININHTGAAGGYQSGIYFATSDTKNYKIDVTGNGDMTWRAGAGETVVMTLDSTGALNLPNQPAFLVGFNTDNNSTGNNTTVNIDLGSATFDQGSNVSSANNNFVAPVTGIYHFILSIRLDEIGSANYLLIVLVTNNRNYEFFMNPSGIDSSTGSVRFYGSCLADMTSGHTAAITVRLNGTGADTADIIGGLDSTFSGFLVA